MQKARIEILDKYKIPYHEVLVSAFDIDTIVYKQYFACLTWMFLANEKPLYYVHFSLCQYLITIYLRHLLSLSCAFSGTFWQMVSARGGKRDLPPLALTQFLLAPYMLLATGRAIWSVRIQGSSGTAM